MDDHKASQLLDIWKTSVSLHIFHDNLKQERIKRFTMVQLALAAGFALTLRLIPSSEANLIFIYAAQSMAACIAGLVYAVVMISLDRRAAEFVRTTKNQIQHVEHALKAHFPELSYMPYQGQQLILSNPPTVSISSTGEYGDPLKAAAKPAARKEAMLIGLVSLGWVLSVFVAMLVTASRLQVLGLIPTRIPSVVLELVPVV